MFDIVKYETPSSKVKRAGLCRDEGALGCESAPGDVKTPQGRPHARGRRSGPVRHGYSGLVIVAIVVIVAVVVVAVVVIVVVIAVVVIVVIAIVVPVVIIVVAVIVGVVAIVPIVVT